MQRPRKSHSGAPRGSRNTVRPSAILAAALIGSAVLAAPAAAEVESVRAGHNITAFHNGDFIAAFGYGVGETVSVDVWRGTHRIGNAFGPTVDAVPDGGALEVNHGPAGAAVQGDCWQGHTPDILPGDRVVVTDSTGGTDSVYVDDINVNSAPVEIMTAAEIPAGSDAEVGDLIQEGNASTGNTRTPIPVEQLTGEVRQFANQYRAEPSRFERIAGTTDGFRAIYHAPYTIIKAGRPQPLNAAEQKQAIITADEHMIGFGHVAPLPLETQIADWPHGGGPALDCGEPTSAFYAPASANAVTTSTDPIINAARLAGETAAPIGFSGTAMADVTAVEVNLSDGIDTVTATTAVTGAGTGQKAWTVEFSAAQVAGLKDGTLTATGTYTLADGTTTTGATMRVRKDTAPPVIDTPAPRQAPAIPATPAQPLGAGVAAIPATPATPALGTARIAGLRSASLMRLKSAKRSGIAASFSSRGLASAEVRLYSLKGGRKLVASKRVGLSDGSHSVRLSSSSMRKRLARGRYLLQVSARAKVVSKSIRIV